MINAKITDIPVPVTRTEHFMYSAITGNESGLKADTQAEMYLDAIKNSDTSDLKGIEPRTVLDMYLEARQTGVVDDLPKPRTTSEMLLYQAITGEDLGVKPVSNMDKYLSLLEPNNYDARLEIESEESIIHLVDSKNGMVEVKELEGNTLVNYIQDGSKELTLTGDIDVEGTSVTLTEGVDNGLVDVICEGNTLVNILNKSLKFGLPPSSYLSCDENGVYNGILEGGNYFARNTDNTRWEELKPNTTYTLKGFLETTCNKIGGGIVFFTQDTSNATKILINFKANELNQRIELNSTFTTPSDCIGSFGFYTNPIANFDNVKFSFILEYGDTTSYEIPPYFEGMKSVGECEDNKIEILSQSKNLLRNTSLSSNEDWLTFQGTIVDGINGNKAIHSTYEDTKHGYYDFLQQHIYDEKDKKKCLIKEDTWYTLSFYAKGVGGCKTYIYPSTIDTNNYCIVDGESKPLHGDGHCDWNLTNEWVRHSFTFKTRKVITHKNKTQQVLFRLMPNDQILNSAMISCVMLEEGKVATNFVNDSSNKKEITLSEPLRALPNGVCDKIVKIGGKWYVERNCGEVLLNGSEKLKDGITTPWVDIGDLENTSRFICRLIDGVAGDTTVKNVCNTVPPIAYVNRSLDIPYCYTNLNEIVIRINKTTINNQGLEGFLNWLRANPTTITYQLATPVYEKLEVEPVLTTYSDQTHISTNSVISCNMKIKNSGYSTIVKPSTQYTVAFDTNKSGTVGINLGGSKVTTTNNVTTITTPSTLVDDSLRLTGKGIKASKVRLLEGDKTNWIPNFFEGMKSCFEDKLQDDGSYKIEITSANTDNTLSNKIQFSSIEPLRGVGDIKDRFVFKDGKLMIERNFKEIILDGGESWILMNNFPSRIYAMSLKGANTSIMCDKIIPRNSSYSAENYWAIFYGANYLRIQSPILTSNEFKQWLSENPATVVYQLAEPTYEEIPYELQKIILEGYENGTLFFDTNIPPKSLISYTANTSNIYRYLDTLKLSKEECDSIINSMERV